MKPRVIMVHGAFCGGWTFDLFRSPFEAAGYEVDCPPLRGHAEGDLPGAVAGVSISAYAADIAARVRAEASPPILLGHSMGGLVAMMAAMQVELAGLILLAPSAPWGITSGTMEEGASALALLAQGAYWSAVDPDRMVARLYSLDKLAPEDATLLSRRMRPESGRALYEALNWGLDPFMTTQVSPSRIKTRVFAAVGERDMIHPPSTVRQTAALLGAEFQVFPDMSHWLVGEPGWEAVAAVCLDFIRSDSPAR